MNQRETEKQFFYDGYTGSAEYDEQTRMYAGRVQGIQSEICYRARNLALLEMEFRYEVDMYLDKCEELDIDPEEPVVQVPVFRVSI